MQLNNAQKRAAEYLDGPLLVLAGPGTGKTQLLSQKVAYILKNTDTNPDSILCMTFTESGASNMRERLRSIIGQDATKVNIGTYHAFGAEILGQYKNYSEDYNRNLDSAIDEVTQYKIVKSIQDNLDGRDILRGDSVKDIVSVISSAKSAGLTASDLQLIANTNIADSQTLSEAISPLLQNIVPRAFKPSYDNAYAPIYGLLKDYTNAQAIVKNVERSIGAMARDLKAAIIDAVSEQKIKPLSSWKDAYFEKDAKGNYRLKDRVANKKLLSIANVMRRYDEYLMENGLYDFDDMIQEALKVLQKDAGFKATLSERYQVIMLDEFQDTNPSQFAIIKELSDYEKPLVMAVGDDDQAIYEFQGALATNLTDFQEHYNADVITLTENYRSTQEILDFSRKVIGQATDRFADKELTAHREGPTSSQIYRHEFLTSEMEYAYIADEISRLIKTGIPQNEIAIISYKTKYFMPLLPYLKAHPEIKIAYEKKDNLLDDEKIHELITLARFVHDMAQGNRSSVSMMEILSYPFFEISPLEVVRLTSKARQEKRAILDVMAESDDTNIIEAVKYLAGMIAKSFNEPLEIMLDYLIGTAELDGIRSHFMEYYSRQDDYSVFSLYEKIASLRGRLKKHFGDRNLKLADLVQMINDYNEADMPINLASPYREADEAVSILSAHKAKGLEFSHVFIISADHMAWGKGKGNNNLLSLPKNLLQIRHTGTTDGEKLRILYVALTRAKEVLYITNSLHDFNGKSPDRLEYFAEYNANDEVVSPLIPYGKVQTHYDATTDHLAEDNLKHWLTPYAKLTPDMRAIYKERISKWRMSASALTSFIDIVYAGPVAFFESYILQAPREPETEALAYGDLVHKTFEQVTKLGLDNKQAISFFLDELNKKELPIETVQKLREKGPVDLDIALTAFKGILLNGKAEVNLATDNISIDGVPVTGKIDHILIDEKNKTIEVYDFKTGSYHKEKWQSHATLYKYMLQLVFYKLLLNNSSTYRNYKVTKAHILFVVPDKDDEVYDKVYEYNDEDEKEIKTLIKAVYQLIVSLDFIDDKELFIPADNSLTLKDIKKFIELLLAKRARL